MENKDNILKNSMNKSCIKCEECPNNCKQEIKKEKSATEIVMEKINDPTIYTVAQTAPSIRTALGEEFELEIGTNVKGKMITALKKLGFDSVFDTCTGADFTIVEEANEFLNRITDGGKLPQITSCCPAWVRFAEMNYPELMQNLSSCKSPHQMLGAIVKSYFAQKQNIDPKKIFLVSVMPCLAKRFEINRPEMQVDGIKDVDEVITTRELAQMIKQKEINFNQLPDSEFDNPLGEASGAGTIFGTTGGVMEAALRTAAEMVEGKDLQNIEYEAVRGEQGIKKATVTICDKQINVAVISGLNNAKQIMEEIKNGTSNYHFIEVMTCPGGCIMGGGQPIPNAETREKIDVRERRANCLYSIDEKSTIRKAHENPNLQQVYKEFFEKIGSDTAHKYLHTRKDNQK
mgnify:FL=1